MKTRTYLSSLIVVFFFSAGVISAQDSTHQNHSHKHHMEMKKDTSKTQMDHDTSIVREGTIDLNAIDVNKDGKVYQDMMDWNVISDAPGTCPICGMTLKEVTINEAKNNLVKNGFEVKD